MKEQLSRRTFLKTGTVAGVGLSLPWDFGGRTVYAQVAPQVPLAGAAIPRLRSDPRLECARGKD